MVKQCKTHQLEIAWEALVQADYTCWHWHQISFCQMTSKPRVSLPRDFSCCCPRLPALLGYGDRISLSVLTRAKLVFGLVSRLSSRYCLTIFMRYSHA